MKKTREQELLEEIALQVQEDIGRIDMQEVNRRYNKIYSNANKDNTTH